MSHPLGVIFLLLAAPLQQSANDGEVGSASTNLSYPHCILEDKPVAYWRFENPEETRAIANSADPSSPQLTAAADKRLELGATGPAFPRYPLFQTKNQAIHVGDSGGWLRVADPGNASPLDFQNGDWITMEAWVNPDTIGDGQFMYVFGKGRTNNSGVPRDNQNYALRLHGKGGHAHVSFLFRDSDNRAGKDDDFHRWTSLVGFGPDGAWHHVAVVYRFGHPETIRAYVDGEESKGKWDMGGASTQAPVVDNDELWIGSAMGGNRGNTFAGELDEVALYRAAVPADRLRSRYQAAPVHSREEELKAAADLPTDRIVVQLFEGIPVKDAWPVSLPPASLRYTQSALAFVGLPKKYTSTGVIDDRSNPLLLTARTKLKLSAETAGNYDWVLRSKGGARLFVDGKLLAQIGFMTRNASGHEAVPEVTESSRHDLRPLPPGCQEKMASLTLEPGEHVIRLEAFVGGKGLRMELDELCVAMGRPSEPLRLVTADHSSIAATEEAWQQHRESWLRELDAMDRASRRATSEAWSAYWNRRHEYARTAMLKSAGTPVPAIPDGPTIQNDLDRFLAVKLAEAEITPTPRIDDLAFLRRVTLDTVGVVPSRDEITRFQAADPGTRRAKVIDQLLSDERWADHWVGYWQDALAENPGILKPELNNSGPFRWWIYESLLDNKPFDQFASELAMMEGSVYYGGPAGFGLATQNDSPLAAKAHVLAKAFLAMDMHCARCHDAPYHPFKQEELFGIAAMLNRKPIKLPETSTVPVAEGARKPLVKISLKPGAEILPAWPTAHAPAAELPQEFIRHADDSRERVGLALTSPHNSRFAKVIVNRVWQRLMGRGIIEPVDDWEAAQGEVSHPELLEYLARDFVMHGYDLKHLTREIMNSHAYQREASGGPNAPGAELFAGPARRRLSAEQLVDSLFAIAGKDFQAELLTLDPEGRRPIDTFLNLGTPHRAWQFTSLSNERDRPALALPIAQGIVDLLVSFGWRDARPNPVTYRDEEPTALQPLTLANGIAGNRSIRLSEDSEWTELCLQDLPLDKLVNEIFLRTLTRLPAEDERELFVQTLADGYELRRTGVVVKQNHDTKPRHAVSWSNHLSGEATRIKQELERAVRAGDPPTSRLQSQWRERMEDALWALLNTPEFVFVP